MSDSPSPRVVIVDYGMGNLFSVLHACQQVRLDATITASKEEIVAADAVILPGVGAFGDAMNALRRLDLIGVLKDAAQADKPFLGICLGMQLLMTESYEFGCHKGLSIVMGSVGRFKNPEPANGNIFKVPHVQWNQIREVGEKSWSDTLLRGIQCGSFVYFVHSFYCIPENQEHVLSNSIYGDAEFCSSLEQGNIFLCQYHPERSGPIGLKIYENFSARINAYHGCQAQ
jgi:imidazole glycerol-phosphate synthase subunit HisH